jgi:uncharacterized Rmd1/YagE family protein
MDKNKGKSIEQEPLLPYEMRASLSERSNDKLHKDKPNQLRSSIGTKEKMMPKRTTKISQKLTIFPSTEGEYSPSKERSSAEERLPHVAAKIDKERLFTSQERKWLPRVTAYATAK